MNLKYFSLNLSLRRFKNNIISKKIFDVFDLFDVTKYKKAAIIYVLIYSNFKIF